MKNISKAIIFSYVLLHSELGYTKCDEELVSFSSAVYDDWGNSSTPLPDGWNYYTQLPANLQNGGYYAQSYIHCSSFDTKDYKYCDVAIANRGTTLSITDLYEDFLVLLELTPNYYNNAKDYLDYIIKKMISDGIYKDGLIDVTGHSLGAIISELIYTEVPDKHRAFGRVFDSPGSKKILTNMVDSGILPKNALSVSTHGVIRLYSPPNAINTTNEQIRNENNIIISITSFPHEDFSSMNLETMSSPSYLYYFKDYSINQHKIINFYNYCLPYNGLDSNTKHKKYSGLDWPVGFFDSYKYYLGDGIYNNRDYWSDYFQYAWDNSLIFKKIFDNDIGSFEDKFRMILEDSSIKNKSIKQTLNNSSDQLTNEFNLPDFKTNQMNELEKQSNFAKIVSKNLTGNSETVRLIYNNASIDKKLYYAILSDDMYLGEKLLADGHANPNSLHGDKKYNLLQISVIMGHLDMIRLLLKYHANPNIQNSDGDTVLHTVAHERYGDSADYAKVLIEGGINSRLKNHDGMTALMIMKKHCLTCVKTFSNYAPE